MKLYTIKHTIGTSVNKYTKGCRQLVQYCRDNPDTTLLSVADVLEIPVRCVEDMLEVGNGGILPDVGFHNCPGHTKLKKFPVATQRALLNKAVPVLTLVGTKYEVLNVVPRNMTGSQANLVFTSGYQRTVKEQEYHLELLEKKRRARYAAEDYTIEGNVLYFNRPGSITKKDLKKLLKEM